MAIPTRDSVQKTYLERQGRRERKAQSVSRSFQQAAQASQSGDHDAINNIMKILGDHLNDPDTHRASGWLADIFPYEITAINYNDNKFVTDCTWKIYDKNGEKWFVRLEYTYDDNCFETEIAIKLIKNESPDEDLYKHYQYIPHYDAAMFLTRLEKVVVLEREVI